MTDFYTEYKLERLRVKDGVWVEQKNVNRFDTLNEAVQVLRYFEMAHPKTKYRIVSRQVSPWKEVEFWELLMVGR